MSGICSINGISTRKYEKAVEKIPETFGISKSSISQKFIKASAQKLKELNERDLNDPLPFSWMEKVLRDDYCLGSDLPTQRIIGFVENFSKISKKGD